ncbi:hypothetical protein ABZ307_38060 [Streptomyces griseorubiginosus]|uniref:hypothetical protein n=1 Tax=Streptomyces griseorubiginosus TaxID=67304 RepID=UPI0033A30E51
MGEVVTVSIAVAGTLLGALLTHLFQRRAVLVADQAARDRDLRLERINAYSQYAAAVIDAANAELRRWHYQQRPSAEFEAARLHLFDRRSAARQAMYRVLLLTSDPRMHRLAEEAFDAARRICDAATHEDSEELTRQCRVAVTTFVDATREEIQ